MPFETVRVGELEYETASCIAAPHCFTTRLGGVSQGHLAALNLGHRRGDRPGNVMENYRILGRAMGFSVRDVVFTKQIHTDRVERVGQAQRGQGLMVPVPSGRDGLITDEANVTLTVFGADCTPILLYDPVRRAVGACHAGWRGTALGIAAKTVQAMQREFGCAPGDMRAAIGPCIGVCCFQTDGDVPQAMRQALGASAEPAIHPVGPKYQVDLKLLNRIWLEQAGVRQVEVSPDCTACQPLRYWSHRVSGGLRGSQAALIRLP